MQHIYRSPQPATAQIAFQPRTGMVVLMLTVVVGLFQLDEIEGVTTTTINVLAPLSLLAALTGAAYWLVRETPWLLFTPIVPFLIACGIYYGFGPLLYGFGSLATVEYVQSFYFLDETTLLRTNQLNIVGVFVVCLTFAAVLRLFPLRRPAGRFAFDQKMCDKFIFLCLAIGAPVRYFLVPLHNAGSLGFYIPSQALAPSSMVFFALTLMIWTDLSGDRKWRPILFPVLGFELAIRIAGGNKYEFFLLTGAILFGVYLAKPRMKTLYAGAAAVIVLWLFMSSATTLIRENTFAGRNHSLSQRLGTAFSVLQTSGEVVPDDSAQGWWSRLCYAPAQGFCLHRFDAGYPGETINLWYWSFLPRLLFPEKPEMTTGKMFNVLVTGNPNSKSAPGLFAEAYWNGGWPLAIAAAAYVGTLFAVLTHVVPRCFIERDFRWMPIVWCGVVMGLRVDDWAIPTYLGSLPVAISTCLLLFMLFPSSSLKLKQS